jgi:hypothetical protein
MTLTSSSLSMLQCTTFDDHGDAWIPYHDGFVGRFRRDRLQGSHVKEPDLVFG